MSDDLAAAFARRFGRDPTVVGVASGRVNLIGEHTDYNDGFVLPAPIPQRTRVALRPNLGGLARVASLQEGGSDAPPVIFALGEEARRGDWTDYLQGATADLQDKGFTLRGFDALVASDVPMGAGLASSAALTVAFLQAYRHALALAIDDVGVALTAQRAENDFVGARVGIMDQMAASLLEPGFALFLDTRELSYRRIALPFDVFELFVINSGVRHSNVHGDYNTRRQECETACRLLGVASLRAFDGTALSRMATLAEPYARRARHVVTENARVLDAVSALEARDPVRLGALFAASHASMRDDYAVSVPEIDMLVTLAAACPEVFGARLTGGGFGGSIVGLAAPGTARDVTARIVERYRSTTGRTATVLVPEISLSTASTPPRSLHARELEPRNP